MSNLTIEGKVLVFKSVAISKIAHAPLITTVKHAIINQLDNILKKSLYGTKKIQNKAFDTFKQLQRRWFERRCLICKNYDPAVFLDKMIIC